MCSVFESAVQVLQEEGEWFLNEFPSLDFCLVLIVAIVKILIDSLGFSMSSL